MCFDLDSAPPLPDLGTAAVERRDLALTASDGADFSAFEALGSSDGAGVVILPDVRGLYRFYRQLAVCFAQEGHDAVAIDYFGRTAGVGGRDEDFDFMEHVRQATFAGVKADTAAAVAHLRRRDPDRAVFTVGFCFGGSNSWHQAANGHDLSGAIGFYGHPDRPGFPQQAPGVIERVDDIACPILGLMGGADPGIPEAEVERFRNALGQTGIEQEIISYPGAPHSFFDRTYEQFREESADAWYRVLRFVAAHS